VIDWNDGLSVGVPSLDEDHKKILLIINKLYKASGSNNSSQVLEEIFKELRHYIITHFQKEEAFLQRCNYKNIQEHKLQHQHFIEEVERLHLKLITSINTTAAEEIIFFLTDWLINHIIEEDMPILNLLEQSEFYNNEKNQRNDSPITKLVKKVTDSFSFAKRFFLSAAIPLSGMILLIGIILYNNYEKHQETVKTARVLQILFPINKLVHALQIERGLSSGYLSAPKKFKKNMLQQRKIVNSAIEELENKLQHIDKNRLAIIKAYSNKYKIALQKLHGIRQRIDKQELLQPSIIAYYTNLIHHILSISSQIAIFNVDKDISSSIHALDSFLQYKEILGQERAWGVMNIEQKKQKLSSEYVTLLKLFGAEKMPYDDFLLYATAEQQKLLRKVFRSQIVSDVIFYKNSIEKHRLKSLDSQYWFNIMTQFINQLKELEDTMQVQINKLIQAKLDKEFTNLVIWVFFTTLIFLITAFIIYIFKRSSQEELYNITNAIQHLAEGKRDFRLVDSKAKGEIAQIYQAYEKTRQKLLKGDIYTQLYLTQKELEIHKQKKENEKLENLAFVDSLTGVINRRRFDELSNIEFNRAVRYKSELSFLMLDIDHFKQINDTYGHPVGDKVLQNFATLCLEIAREFDVVARVGGEEFIIMLPQTDAEGAYTFAERLRKKIANTKLSFNDATLTYSVSIGISSVKNERVPLEDILVNADRALYKAKQGGRNQSVIYTEEI
jgi:diguanylate cyclase (GGDEF)-like protein/hemerythrin-like metal-binding protein